MKQRIHPFAEPAEPPEAPARELAQRKTGSDEILLLWHPDGDRIELLVHDPDTGAGVLVEVAPGDALDAFYHPYVYTSEGESSQWIVERNATIVDA